jgi:hypothetical protein
MHVNRLTCVSPSGFTLTQRVGFTFGTDLRNVLLRIHSAYTALSRARQNLTHGYRDATVMWCFFASRKLSKRAQEPRPSIRRMVLVRRGHYREGNRIICTPAIALWYNHSCERIFIHEATSRHCRISRVQWCGTDPHPCPSPPCGSGPDRASRRRYAQSHP